jgi:hypothetical protein
MLLGVAVHLTGACHQVTSVFRLGQAKGIVGSERAYFKRLNGVHQVIDGAGGAREVKDVVDRTVERQWLRNVVFDKVEPRLVQECLQILFAAGDKIVNGDNLMAVGE